MKKGCSIKSVTNDRHILTPETQQAHKKHRSDGVAFCSESELGVWIWTSAIHLSDAISGFESNPVGSKKSKIAKLSPAIKNRSRKASSLEVILSEMFINLSIPIY